MPLGIDDNRVLLYILIILWARRAAVWIFQSGVSQTLMCSVSPGTFIKMKIGIEQVWGGV